MAKALTLSASTVAPGPSTPTHEAQLNEVILRLHHGQLARVLYVGVTSDLERRVLEHKKGLLPGFTSKYHITWLVYYEVHERAIYAIERRSVSRLGAGTRRWLWWRG